MKTCEWKTKIGWKIKIEYNNEYFLINKLKLNYRYIQDFHVNGEKIKAISLLKKELQLVFPGKNIPNKNIKLTIQNDVFIGHINKLTELKKLEEKRNMKLEIEKAFSARIIGYKYEVGCDCPDTNRIGYDFPENISFEAAQARRDADQELNNAIKKLNISEIAKKYNANTIDENCYSYGGFIFDETNVNFLINSGKKKAEEIKTKKEKTKKDRIEKENELIELAKKTGKKQLKYSYTENCNDPTEDCDIDTIYVFIDGKGIETIERSHNW